VRRLLFNLAAGVSLLLLLLTIAVWVRSFSCAQSLRYDSQPDRGSRWWVHLGTGLGRAFVFAGSYETKIPTEIDLQSTVVFGFHATSRAFSPSAFKPTMPELARSYDHEVLGLGWSSERSVVVRPQINRTFATYAIAAPYWMLGSIFAVAPGAWSIRWLRRKDREQTMRCMACGYDLRATPDRCPECVATNARAGGVNAAGIPSFSFSCSYSQSHS
jgi:hypothetical protein